MTKEQIVKAARHAFTYSMGPAKFAKAVSDGQQKITRKNAIKLIEAYKARYRFTRHV